jgi:hypothetical protein
MDKVINKTILIFITVLFITGAGAAANAAASDELATVGLQLTPSGKIYKDAYRPAALQLETLISTSSPAIYPMRRARLTLGPNIRFNLNPKMPVCPDSQVGPNVNISAPVEIIVARCPRSVIGNGTALFQLAGINDPGFQREGYMVIFNGGTVQGRPKIKIYAYSYATTTAVYTESVLSASGQLNFAVPQLSFDSAVTSLNLDIPGQEIPITDPTAPPDSVVPPGQDNNYAQARCPGDQWALDGWFLLGNRDSSGTPIPPEETVEDQATQACSGLPGAARLGALAVSGPSQVRRGKRVVYRVTIKNRGTANARGLTVKVGGKKIKVNKKIGILPAESSKKVRLAIRPRVKGRQKVRIVASSGNAVAVSKTVRLRVK